MWNWIKRELVLKLDFEKAEFEIGWIWVILLLPQAYIEFKYLIIDLILIFS